MLNKVLLRNVQAIATIVLLFFLSGCNQIRIASIFIPKRDVLSMALTNMLDSQNDTKDQFVDALTKYKKIVKTEDSNLQQIHATLDAEYKESKGQVENLRKKINDVEYAGEELFKEWQKELSQYHDQKLKEQSLRQLSKTRLRYQSLLKAMKEAEAKTEPILKEFGDQVLVLKHNLNAQAIESLKGELREIELSVNSLIEDLESSIKESNDFIKTWKQEAISSKFDELPPTNSADTNKYLHC